MRPLEGEHNFRRVVGGSPEGLGTWGLVGGLWYEWGFLYNFAWLPDDSWCYLQSLVSIALDHFFQPLLVKSFPLDLGSLAWLFAT